MISYTKCGVERRLVSSDSVPDSGSRPSTPTDQIIDFPGIDTLSPIQGSGQSGVLDGPLTSSPKRKTSERDSSGSSEEEMSYILPRLSSVTQFTRKHSPADSGKGDSPVPVGKDGSPPVVTKSRSESITALNNSVQAVDI